MGKSTLGDLTKTAKEAASKKGFIKTDEKTGAAVHGSAANQVATQKQMNNPPNTGGSNFFSNIGTDFNGLASSTTTMFSGMFGGKSKFRLSSG